MIKEEHITYDDKLAGMVFVPKYKVFKYTKVHVRYSAGNKLDTISFSDDKYFMVQFDTRALRKLLDKYENEE